MKDSQNRYINIYGSEPLMWEKKERKRKDMGRYGKRYFLQISEFELN